MNNLSSCVETQLAASRATAANLLSTLVSEVMDVSAKQQSISL